MARTIAHPWRERDPLALSVALARKDNNGINSALATSLLDDPICTVSDANKRNDRKSSARDGVAGGIVILSECGETKDRQQSSR